MPFGAGDSSAIDAFLFTAARQADAWRAADIIRRRQRVYEVLEASTTMRPMARSAARDASGVDGSPALLWVGRLNANKDPLTVLAGFERIVVPCPDASLTMVFGSDELLPEVRARLSASPALGRRVRLVGYVPHGRAARLLQRRRHLRARQPSRGQRLRADRSVRVRGGAGRDKHPGISRDHRRRRARRAVAAGRRVGLAHALLEMAKRDLAGLRAGLAVHFANELSWTAVGRRALDIYAEVRARRRSSR